MRGRFITFEGPEGAGKSTQVRRLQAALEGANVRAVVTREPGGTRIGEAIRALLLDPDGCAMLAETEALLMTAARAQHVGEVIRPSLEAGAWVLCDRFADSTLAYQGGGRGLSLDDLAGLQRFATGRLAPDLTLLFDLPVEVGLQRRWGDEGAPNRLDAESLGFHRAVRETFLALAAAEPSRWVVIDASQPAGEVTAAMLRAVGERFGVALLSREAARVAGTDG